MELVCVDSMLLSLLAQCPDISPKPSSLGGKTKNHLLSVMLHTMPIELEDRHSVAMQWAERMLPEGGSEQWGENWEENFARGKGGKKVGHVPPSNAHFIQAR